MPRQSALGAKAQLNSQSSNELPLIFSHPSGDQIIMLKPQTHPRTKIQHYYLTPKADWKCGEVVMHAKILFLVEDIKSHKIS